MSSSTPNHDCLPSLAPPISPYSSWLLPTVPWWFPSSPHMHCWPGFDPFNIYPSRSHDFLYIASSSANTNHSLPSTSSSHLPSECMWSTPFQSSGMEFGNTATGHSTQPQSIFWVCKLKKGITTYFGCRGKSTRAAGNDIPVPPMDLILRCSETQSYYGKDGILYEKEKSNTSYHPNSSYIRQNILNSYLKILKLRMQYVPLYFPFILSYLSLSSTFS